jgi:hypothetical protein
MTNDELKKMDVAQAERYKKKNRASNIDTTTLSELGLRRLDLSDITLSESCSKSPTVIISQGRHVFATLKHDDLKKAIEFMQSVINYEGEI